MASIAPKTLATLDYKELGTLAAQLEAFATYARKLADLKREQAFERPTAEAQRAADDAAIDLPAVIGW